MKEPYYAITYNLDVIPLGEHESFDSADEVATALNTPSGILYVCTKESLDHLKGEIERNA